MQTGSLLKLGIIGYPIHHTLSPLLHSTLLKELGLTGSYTAFETPPETLASQLDRLKSDGLHGLNVTIPHKVAVLPLLQRVAPSAERLQSVNTLVFDPQGITGHNTDLPGFVASLPPDCLNALPDTNVLILGAGGSARTVLAAMADCGAASVTVCRRDATRSAALEALTATWPVFSSGAAARLTWTGFQDIGDLSRFGLIVNTTPVGMASHSHATPLDERLLSTLTPGTWVLDLIYRPQQTRLMQLAETHGARTQNGLLMLVHQGIAAFEIWTGLSVQDTLADTVHTTLLDALQ